MKLKRTQVPPPDFVPSEAAVAAAEVLGDPPPDEDGSIVLDRDLYLWTLGEWLRKSEGARELVSRIRSWREYVDGLASQVAFAAAHVDQRALREQTRELLIAIRPPKPKARGKVALTTPVAETLDRYQALLSQLRPIAPSLKGLPSDQVLSLLERSAPPVHRYLSCHRAIEEIIECLNHSAKPPDPKFGRLQWAVALLLSSPTYSAKTIIRKANEAAR